LSEKQQRKKKKKHNKVFSEFSASLRRVSSSQSAIRNC